MIDYKNKYLKYKNKYIQTKKNIYLQMGGVEDSIGGAPSDYNPVITTITPLISQLEKTDELKITIDDFIFELISKATDDDNRKIINIKSTNNNHTESFSLYSSNSEMGMWRLAIPHGTMYDKLNDYITTTFVHISLQKFISEKYNYVAGIYPLKNHYMLDEKSDMFRTFVDGGGEVCQNETYNELSTFVKEIKAICGELVKDVLFDYDIDSNMEKVKTFIDNHQLGLSYSKDLSNYDNKFLHNRIFIIKVIQKYIELKFNILGQEEMIYHYTTELTRKSSPEKITDIDCNVYKLIITDGLDSFEYYYLDYKLNNNLIFKEYSNDFINQTYYIPLFIIPQNTRVNHFGVYNCYMPSSFYFCKPMDYLNQIIGEFPLPGTVMHHDVLIKRNIQVPKGFNFYLFIGDLISPFTFKSDNKEASISNSTKLSQLPPQHEEKPPQHEEEPPQHEEKPPQHEEEPPQHEEEPPQHEEEPPQHEEKPEIFKKYYSSSINNNLDSYIKKNEFQGLFASVGSTVAIIIIFILLNI